MLAQYGTLVDCNVMIDRGTGRNRGFAYATFSTPAGANAACRGGDNNMMDGKWVVSRTVLPPLLNCSSPLLPPPPSG